MLKYIAANKAWIFSGVGVLAITLLFAGVKTFWIGMATKAPAASWPKKENPDAEILLRHSQTKRISVGDYHSFGADSLESVRIQVLGVQRSLVGDRRDALEEDVALLKVDGIGALKGGKEVAAVGGEAYLVPALDQAKSLSRLGSPEADRCLFAFHTQEYFLFESVCVTHVNPRDHWVDVNVQEVRKH